MASIPSGRRTVAPAHPGVVVADLLEDNGVSMRGAARAIGMSSTGLNKVLLGQSPVTPETALRLAAYFGNTPELWLDMQRAHDLWNARAAIGKDVEKIKPLGK
jgi:addiction module HigA family antidote